MNLLKFDAPGLIVVPGNEADLASSVAFAFKHGLRVVVQCSGHDFNGRSSGEGVMLIQTRRLKSVQYSNTTGLVTFGAGASHGDLYRALVRAGRVYVGGQSKTVCPAGCLSGGCHGLLSRQYGLGIDNIVSIRFILYNGTVLTLSATSHAALFNAYLGAGANSFGVASGFTAQTYPAPQSIWQVRADLKFFNASAPGHPGYNALSAFIFNTTFIDSVPNTVSGNINLVGDTVKLDLIYMGSNASSPAAAAALAPLFVSPFFVASSYQQFSWRSVYELAENNYPPASEIWQRKFITNALLPPDQALLTELGTLAATTQPYMWLWLVFGGAVRNGTAGSVSPGMRAAMYEVLLGAHWNNPGEDASNMRGVDAAIREVYKKAPYSYPNEYTSWGNRYNPLRDWKTRFFGNASAYGSLLAVKRAYDPCNMFVVQFGVGWDLPQGTCSGNATAPVARRHSL